ncbi:hypothetical protein PR003_g12504 [Phytophthora rubi]|uniref:Uncharacterized protein n=1 Tax=Phytophthora rubi TaxID=129364 RepID=A0A6A3LYZ0_9STRA|nr:hypothetical protein PR002_g13071 [Phytophthora rubi]KAE9024476.1 hypothetical protein PR001_g12672 [Phytophthora rubi]KAE9336457.1 hypothetical protein PR003_g12504 [Phytophthora rubi]
MVSGFSAVSSARIACTPPGCLGFSILGIMLNSWRAAHSSCTGGGLEQSHFVRWRAGAA